MPTMASSLLDIADSLVPEEERRSQKSVDDDHEDDEFQRQLHLALKLSLNDCKSHEGSPKINLRRKFRKSDRSPNSKNVVSSDVKRCYKMFATNDVTKLSFEEQLRLAEERSKFDVDFGRGFQFDAADNNDLERALLKSKDPSEQIDPDHQLLLQALEISKLESDSSRSGFCDSDSMSVASSSGSSKSQTDILLSCKRQLHDVNGKSTRKRGGGGSNLPLSVIDGYALDQDSKLAFQLSLNQFSKNSPVSVDSYVGAAKKKSDFVKIPQVASSKLSAAKNIFASPTRVISANSYQLKRRPIIVDGCNVAFQHGKNERYSAKGLLIVYQYFVNRHGYTDGEITIVNKHSSNLTDDDQKLVDYLYKNDVLIYAPSRKVGGRLICCDDDLFVLNLAKEKNGVVVSLDQFRDAYSRTTVKEIKDVIKYRLLQFAFKGDEVIFPTDPLGPKGPSLDEFLRME